MVKRLFLSLILLCGNSYAETVNKVVFLGTTEQLKVHLAKQPKLDNGIEFHAFSVDESSKILRHFESLFPKEMNKEPEHVKNRYLEKHISPRLKAYAPEIMRSEMGLSLAKLYRLERVPAVVINDRYITYGLTVTESLRAFEAMEKRG